MLFPNAVVAQHLTAHWEWSHLAPIPDTMGYAGAYVGTLNDYLVVAGGANFPDGTAPWDGGKKVWTDRAFVLKKKDGEWAECRPLPQQMGYGASVSYSGKMYIAGGSNQEKHLNEVYEISWDGETEDLIYNRLDNLPVSIANCASVLVGHHWYIIGGILSPDAQSAENACWKLDLQSPDTGWKRCADIPGKGRMLSVVANMGNRLVVLSGVALKAGQREYLQDAYILDTGDVWSSLPNLPHAVAAAAGPAYYEPKMKKLFVFGGDDGELSKANLKHQHPGFSNRILQFDSTGKRWTLHSQIDIKQEEKVWVPVTTGAIYWNGSVVLPSGEIRPGIRSPQVLIGELKYNNQL